VDRVYDAFKAEQRVGLYPPDTVAVIRDFAMSSRFHRPPIAHEVARCASQPRHEPQLTYAFGVDLGGHDKNRSPTVGGPNIDLGR
jgi:hypothetical protein